MQQRASRTGIDARRYAPAAERNPGPILDVLGRDLPPAGTILEIGSATGQHVIAFAAAHPEVCRQPGDPPPRARASIAAWAVGSPPPSPAYSDGRVNCRFGSAPFILRALPGLSTAALLDSRADRRRASADMAGRPVHEKVTIRIERADRPDVTALLLQGRALLAGLYPPESRHGLDLAAYERPEVTLFVARWGGVAVGCGALQRHRDGSAEVKSMFVIPEARRRGIGRAILETIEAALPEEVVALRLETGIRQAAAIRLYEAAGFRRRGPFGSYRDDPLSVFMEKPL